MKDMAPISIQLYSLREASTKSFDQVLKDVADIGYKGVEPFHLFGKTPAEFRKQVEDLGMRVSSSHYPWTNRHDSINEVIDVVSALGLTRAMGGFAPDDFADLGALQRTIETTQRMAEELRQQGLTLCLHNHWWEYNNIAGRPGYHYLQDSAPEIEFELDTYWAANFGAIDLTLEIPRISRRMPLMHIKDGPLLPDQPHVAVGNGTMNIPRLFDMADAEVLEWCVVELDDCATDMMTAVEQSYTYLTSNQLAEGNR